MSRKYSKSPITEATCEFRLAKESSWDLTIPGLLYEKVRGQFPNRRSAPIHETILKPSGRGLAQKHSLIDRIQLVNNTGNRLLQISDRSLSINMLKPYPSWEEFRNSIKESYDNLLSLISLSAIERIGLRYINSISFPEEVALEKYFNFRPFLGKELPRNMEAFFLGCILPFEGERDKCKLEFTSIDPAENAKQTLMLDIDYFLNQPKTVNPENALDWVDKAHEEVEKIFEGCITEELRIHFAKES